MKNKKLVYCLTALACVCIVNCKNPIMEKWWVDKPDLEYVPITKMIPQVSYETIYDTIIEHDVIYKTVYEQLPPQVIHDVVYEQLPPEVIEKIVYEQLPPQVIYVQLPPEVIHDVVYVQLPPQVIETIVYIQLPPQIIYETIIQHEVIYEQLPPEIIHEQPSDEELLEIIKNKPGLVVEIIKQIPPKEIVTYLTDEQIREIIQYIIDNQILTEDQIREIIKQIPPEEIVKYLTDEQIRYIISQQPPQVILQTITIIDIEYIVFAGNADKYNGPHGAGANTELTTQEKASNDASVSAIAQALKDHPDYLIMLHGHANPTDFTDGETAELKKLSEDRAKAVEAEMRTQFKKINGGVDIDDTRVSVSGYGGEKVLFGSNSAYTALNRRVEMILVRVGVEE